MPQVRWYLSTSLLFLATLFLSSPASSASLTLGEYLSQVKEKNLSYQGAKLKRSASEKRARERDLITAPHLFSNVAVRSDGKLPQLPLFTYEKLDTHNFSLGVSKLTSFGLSAKLAYEVDYISYINSSLQATAAAQGFPLTFYDARPVLELTQPLWQNGFGSAVKANETILEEQSNAERFAAQAEADGILVSAEVAYWRLALAKEVVEIQGTALKHAKAIYDYVADKDRRNLGDRADTLQAKALFEARKLELKMAEDEERLALKAFNAFRNAPPSETPDGLQPVDGDPLESRQVSSDFVGRADVRAAEAQAKAVQANARLLAEKDKPSLDLVGSLALNGRSAGLGEAFEGSYRDNRTTYAVGVRFQMPLDLAATSEAEEGARQLEKAAELQLRQRLSDQKTTYEELATRIANAKERFSLAKGLEETQKNKIDYERMRLKQGRTTTYQILMFEQDYLQAELARARTGGELVSLFAQMRLYQGEPE